MTPAIGKLSISGIDSNPKYWLSKIREVSDWKTFAIGAILVGVWLLFSFSLAFFGFLTLLFIFHFDTILVCQRMY